MWKKLVTMLLFSLLTTITIVYAQEEDLLPFNEPVTGAIETEPYVVTLQFYAEEGDIIETIISGSALDSAEITAPDGTLLSGGPINMFSLIEFNPIELPSEGVYTLTIKGREATDYEFVLEKREVPMIAYGESIWENLYTDALDYHFHGEAGDIISIFVVSDRLDVRVELQDENGEVLISDDDSGANLNASIKAFELPHTATYRLVIERTAAISRYTFELYLFRHDDRYLSYDSPQTIDLQGSNSFEFFASDGDVVQLSLDPLPDNVALSVINPNGNVLESAEMVALEQGLVIPQTGAYQLQISSSNAAETAIILEQLAENSLDNGNRLQLHLSPEKPATKVVFTGAEGDPLVRLDLRNQIDYYMSDFKVTVRQDGEVISGYTINDFVGNEAFELSTYFRLFSEDDVEITLELLGESDALFSIEHEIIPYGGP